MAPQAGVFTSPLVSWNSFACSLVATIKQRRPDLLLGTDLQGESIPKDPPAKFFEKEIPMVEDIGQPTTATFFTRSHANPSNW